jgi:Holliday junction resolvasome RuvABC endonuclease subunit
MKVVGIDPSSSCCGVALAVDGEPLLVDAWDRPKNGSAPARLTEYFVWLRSWVAINKPDMACIEFLSVERNAQSTRVVSHYQAASVIACKLKGLVVVEARVTSARKAVLDNGALSKQEAFDEMKKRYPQIQFGRIDKGGGDRTDALVLALAGPSIAEQ